MHLRGNNVEQKLLSAYSVAGSVPGAEDTVIGGGKDNKDSLY